jgi:hypothetical protein
MALVRDGKQGAALGGIGLSKLMPQSLVECRGEQLAFDERGTVSHAPRNRSNRVLT